MKRVIALAAVLTLLLATAAQGAPLRWTWQTPLPQGNDLWSVTYGAGQFVAVGDGGSILTSSDGKSWTLQASPTMVSLRSVIYADGRFVAVGGRPDEAVILTSADGQAWTLAYHGPGPAPVAVTYGAGRFVSVGGCGWPDPQSDRSVLTSADGITWLPQIEENSEGFCGIAFGNDRFVAVSAKGDQALFTSPDGSDWTLTGTAAADELAGWVYRDIVFADGQFVTVQHHGHVRTSVDGVDWRLGDTLNAGAYRGQATVADSRFFVPALLATSADGAAWAPLETGGRIRSVGYGDGVYVAVGEGGLTLTSPDGLTWADPLPDRLPGLNAIASAGGGYVAVGRLGYSVTSPDGITWKPGPWSRNLLREWQAPNYVTLVYGNGRYVALDANGGKLETSTDGVTWRRTWDTGVPAPDGALIFAGGRFVAGTSGGLVISGDGETWQQVYPADRATFTGLAWDGAQYVAAVITGDTRRPLLLSSIDGEDWHVRTAPADRLLSLTYGADKFVALAMRTEGDRAGTVYLLTSRDGLEWTTGSDVPFQKVRYENGLFLANSTELYTSADGENWRAQPTATPVWGAAFLNGRLAVVGANGSVTLSEPVCGIFLDLPASDPACPAVQALVERKVVTGYPDGAFQPEGPVRRAELAKMLTLALGKAPLPDAPLAFTDTYGHWAAAHGYLQAAVDAGAMNGYPDGSFRPDGQVTRAELVKTVLAASDSQPAALKPTYSDVAPDAWYAGWVAAAEQAGLVGPGSHLWSGPTFAPDQPATRAEVVRLLVK